MASSTVDAESPIGFEEFTLFPKLAPELRDMIWKLALPKPRTISISAIPLFDWATVPDDYSGASGDDFIQFKLVSDACPMLRGVFLACRGSRTVALKRYSRAFKTQLEKWLYFDWKNDTLCFDDTMAMYQMCMTGQPEYLRGGKIYKLDPQWMRHISRLALRSVGHTKRPYRDLGEVLHKELICVSLNMVMLQEDWPTLPPRPQNQDAINKQNKQEICKAWKKQLKTDDESKLPQVVWLTPEEMKIAKLVTMQVALMRCFEDLESVRCILVEGRVADLCGLLFTRQTREREYRWTSYQFGGLHFHGKRENAEIQPGASEFVETKGFQQKVNIEEDRE